MTLLMMTLNRIGHLDIGSPQLGHKPPQKQHPRVEAVEHHLMLGT